MMLNFKLCLLLSTYYVYCAHLVAGVPTKDKQHVELALNEIRDLLETRYHEGGSQKNPEGAAVKDANNKHIKKVATRQDTKDDEWEQYKEEHDKIYDDQDEHDKRRELWNDVDDLIDEHNAKHDSGQANFRMEHNHFSDMTDEERSKAFGIKMPPNLKRTPSFKRLTKDSSSLPTTWSWQNTERVGPVVDQGTCGSCWAYSGTAAMEAAYAAKNGHFVKLSEQNMIDCAQSHGCNGGYAGMVFDYAQAKGINSLQSYPATSDSTSTAGQCVDPGNYVAFASGYETVAEDESELQAALYEVGPISVSLMATDEFMHYSSGVFDGSCPPNGTTLVNHAVLLVGYGVEDDGTPYWLIRNSWSESWGMNGYMKLLRGDNHCQITYYSVYPTIGSGASGPCMNSPCQHNGHCSDDGDGGYQCECGAGWSGTNCDQQQRASDSCDSSPCENCGHCSNSGNTYACSCAFGWKGTNCDTQIDLCANSPCVNGGQCTSDGNTYTCTYGTGCQKKRSKWRIPFAEEK